MRRTILIGLLGIAPFAEATVFNVNSGQSTATIQSTINTAGGSGGNSVVFAAGTYNLTTHIIFPCSNGTVYTGPTNSAGIVQGSNNQWGQQTAASPAIINYVANGDSAFIVNGGTGSNPGDGCTLQYFSGRFQIFTGGIPNVSSASTSGVLIQNNTITGNTAAFSNPAGVAIFMDVTTSNSQAIHNYLSNCGDFNDGCGSGAWAGTNNFFDSNIIAQTQEGIGSSGSGTGGSTGGGFRNNRFSGVNRLAIEITNGNSPGVVTGFTVTGNLYIDPIGDPHISPFSGAFSLATGNNGNPGSSGFTFHEDDNIWIANTSFSTGGGNHMFYCEEQTSGATSHANRNMCQGFWPGAPAVAVGNVTGSLALLNDIIEGPNLTTFGMGLGCEYSGTYPNCNFSSGTPIPGPITNTGTTVSATHTQHASTAPSISPASGAFGSPPSITVTTNQSNGSSFYTTNGTTPTTASTLYTGAFACASLPCTVKVLSSWGTGANTAYPFPSGYGYAPSSVTTNTYTSTVTPDINCPTGFTTVGTGPCSISVNGNTDDFWIANHPSTILSGTAAILAPIAAGHQGNSLIRQVQINIQAFTANWTFVGNGLNHAFVVQNQTNQNGQTFSAGAGDEAGCSQMAGGSNIAPNNTLCMPFDQVDFLQQGDSSFTYSSVQLTESVQTTGIPVTTNTGYLASFPTTKFSTSPVPLNSPASTANTFTGHTYNATVVYDGSTMTLTMFDVTAGGACPGVTCFTKVWTGVYLPSIVGRNTAWVGFTAGTSGAGGGAPVNLLINTFTYTINTATGSPSFTAWNANSTYNSGVVSAASPVYSVAPGTYSGTQSVAITTSRTPHNYICYVLSTTPLTPASTALYPHPDNNGGCSAGTLYTAPISISSTATLYAMAGSDNSLFPTNTISPSGLGPPSTLVAATYTIIGALPPGKISGIVKLTGSGKFN